MSSLRFVFKVIFVRHLTIRGSQLGFVVFVCNVVLVTLVHFHFCWLLNFITLHWYLLLSHVKNCLRFHFLKFLQFDYFLNLYIYTFQVFYPSSILSGDFHGDVTYCFLSEKYVAPLDPLTRCSFQCPCVGPQCLEAFLYIASNNVSKTWKLCELFVENVWPKIHWLEIPHLLKCMHVLVFSSTFFFNLILNPSYVQINFNFIHFITNIQCFDNRIFKF